MFYKCILYCNYLGVFTRGYCSGYTRINHSHATSATVRAVVHPKETYRIGNIGKPLYNPNIHWRAERVHQTQSYQCQTSCARARAAAVESTEFHLFASSTSSASSSSSACGGIAAESHACCTGYAAANAKQEDTCAPAKRPRAERINFSVIYEILNAAKRLLSTMRLWDWRRKPQTHIALSTTHTHTHSRN